MRVCRRPGMNCFSLLPRPPGSPRLRGTVVVLLQVGECWVQYPTMRRETGLSCLLGPSSLVERVLAGGLPPPPGGSRYPPPSCASRRLDGVGGPRSRTVASRTCSSAWCPCWCGGRLRRGPATGTMGSSSRRRSGGRWEKTTMMMTTLTATALPPSMTTLPQLWVGGGVLLSGCSS